MIFFFVTFPSLMQQDNKMLSEKVRELNSFGLSGEENK